MATTTLARKTMQSPPTIADRSWPLTQSDTNIAMPERLGTGTLGAALALGGALRGGLAGWSLAAGGGLMLARAVKGHCACYAALGIGQAAGLTSGIVVRRSVTIDRPAAELYAFWRDLTNLPKIMRHVKSVRPMGDNRSHWVVRGPLGTEIQWDAVTSGERENELIQWHADAATLLTHSGSVAFLPAPADRGTEIHVLLSYQPAGGRAAAALARLFGSEPGQEIADDLRKFKQQMESGEMATNRYH